MKQNKKQITKSVEAKYIPTLLMGAVGAVGILVSIALNEPQANVQMQTGCLVAPSQVVGFMLQAVLF